MITFGARCLPRKPDHYGGGWRGVEKLSMLTYGDTLRTFDSRGNEIHTQVSPSDLLGSSALKWDGRRRERLRRRR